MYSLIIVEDDESIRSGIVNLFPWEDTGFLITGDFSNGYSAWNYLQEHPDTNAVLSDVLMPLIDGLELSKRINETYPFINVILISGYRDFTYAQQALQYHVRDFLVKPIQHNTLMLTFLKLKEELDKVSTLPSTPIPNTQYYDKMIRVIKNYVLDNLRTASLEEAAVLVHLSSSYLSRLFKTVTGESFSDYLLNKRMERACTLLQDFSAKIYEIAYETGYDNPKNFTRAFKNYYDITPKEYRERGGHLL